MYRMMSPGPSAVHQEVRNARAVAFRNPDEDLDFVEEYHELCRRISRLLGNEDYETLILGGEGILGLEAAVATLTEPGDRVLVLDNGVFGAGFADFVRLYGGEPVLYTCSYEVPLDPVALRAYLEQDHGFKYATLVHCDTPSGMCNDVAALCPLLQEFGLLTLVDAVASLFGEPLDVNCGMDLVCGGSQKALSAPPGLSFVSISPRAWMLMQERATPVASFYANLLTFCSYYEDKWFPYTMPSSDIAGLRVAVERVERDGEKYIRHARLARACRAALKAGGLALYPQSGYAATVTAFVVPEGLRAADILAEMRQTHGILISGSFGPFAGKLLRIGHMGESAREVDLQETLVALQKTLERGRVRLATSLEKAFLAALDER